MAGFYFEGTPLTSAVEHQQTEQVKLLLENGVDVNEKDRWGFTPLMLASRCGNLDIVKLLCEYGADVNAKSADYTAISLGRARDGNVHMHTALSLAKYYDYNGLSECVIQELLKHGAKKGDGKFDLVRYYGRYRHTDTCCAVSGDISPSLGHATVLPFPQKKNQKSMKAADFWDQGEMAHLAAIEKSMSEKGTLTHALAHGVLAGPARSGKSSLMKRLTGEMPDSTSPSTGVAEQVVQVGVKKSYSVALGVLDSIWFKLQYDEEAIRLMTLAIQYQQPAISVIDTPRTQRIIPVWRTAAVTHEAMLHNDKFENSTSPISSETPFIPSASASLLSPAKHEEKQPSISFKVAATPAGYVAPMGLFESAIKVGRGLEGLQKYFKNSWSLYLTDTGGQVEFQELLPLLVSGPSIFFLTFCLHQDLNKRFTIEYHLPDGGRSEPYQSTLTVMEAILHSLASIASMGTFVFKGPKQETIHLKPKVFIVGTHKDLLNQDTVDSEIQKIDQHIQTAIKSTSHYQEDFFEFVSKSQLIFTVNNLSQDDADFREIRTAVERVVNRSEFQVTFPSHWLIFSLVLRQEMIKDSVISYDQCKIIAQDCGITDYEELNHALQFLHAKIGLVRYFPIPDLHDVVIRHPQILFDMVTKLIVNTFTFKNVCQRKLTEFEKKGIFTIEDLAQIEQFSIPLLPLTKLLKLLEHLRIIAPFQEDGKKKYFIPCVLAHSEEAKIQSLPIASDIPPLLITFKCGYCPKGVPGALIKYVITNEMGSKFEWELMTDQIFKDQVSFFVSPYDTITLKIHPTYLELTHSAMSKLKRNHEEKDVCNSVRLSIEKGIEKVSSDMKLTSHAKHSLTFYCQNSECNQNKLHPATKVCQNEDGSFCNLWCKNSGKIQLSPLPDGYSVWFGKEGRGCDGINSCSPSLLPLENTMAIAIAEHDMNTVRLQDLAISDTDGQALKISMAPVPQLSEVFKVLLPVASEWENIAVLLSIPHDRVKAIRQENLLIVNSCLRATLVEWLNQTNPRPSWNTLAEAMELLNNPAKAQEIKEKYAA